MVVSTEARKRLKKAVITSKNVPTIMLTLHMKLTEIKKCDIWNTEYCRNKQTSHPCWALSPDISLDQDQLLMIILFKQTDLWFPFLAICGDNRLKRVGETKKQVEVKSFLGIMN